MPQDRTLTVGEGHPQSQQELHIIDPSRVIKAAQRSAFVVPVKRTDMTVSQRFW
jgi:hypothetical protein